MLDEGSATGYAICTVGRSGSNWLCQVLASTGVLGNPLEWFNVVGRRRLTDPSYPDDRTEQLGRIRTDGATPNGVYAVKVFPVHLDAVVAAGVRWTAALPRLRFVHLGRRDLLGQAISTHRADATLQYRSTQAPTATPDYAGARILSHLRRIVQQQARWEAFFARNAIEPVRFVYEEIVRDPQAACDAVAALLELPERALANPAGIDLAVQRDDVTAEWRARFLADFADRDTIDTI